MSEQSESSGRDGKAGELVSIGVVSKELGLSPSRIRQLIDEGFLPEAGRTTGGHRRFDLAAIRDAWATRRLSSLTARPSFSVEVWRGVYPLVGGDEEVIWRAMRDALSLSGPALSAAHYVVTEMINNAIDHSGGTTVQVTAGRDVAGHVAIAISDDGEGTFRHLARGLDLDSDLAALGELTKGKRTTDPANHTGEGIFFSSKAVEMFALAANRICLIFDNVRDDFAAGTSNVKVGTRVSVVIDPDTTTTMADLFSRWTNDLSFNRTRPRVKLFELGVVFVSRSEAKRLATNLEQFEEVELDFAGVTEVGQGFVDELFRVWAARYPETTLHPINMNDPVAFMVERARAS